MVTVSEVAEGLAAVSDDEDGFNPATVGQVGDRLRVICQEMDIDTGADLTVGQAREAQDAYIARLKAGLYSSRDAVRWNTAEARRMLADQTAADEEGLT
jgi:hypothetical protein